MTKLKNENETIHPLAPVINKAIDDFEETIKIIVQDAIKETETQLTKAEIKSIVYELLPNIDNLISIKVKQHFLEIGEYLVSKTKEGE